QRLRSLLIAHVFVGILCCGLVATRHPIPFILPHLPLVALFAIILSQAYLLGLWTAFTDAGLWARLFVLSVGTVYLEGLIALAAGEWGLKAAAATPSITTTGVLLAARVRGREIRRITHPASQRAREFYQFKIQGLMILIFVLALVFA